MGSAAALLAACAPKQPTPAPVAAPQATTAPAQAPQKVEGPITLRFMSRQGDSGIHHREFAKRFSDESEGKIVVECEDTAWGEIQKKLETQFLTGTMVDLAVMSTRDYPYLTKRGCFLVLDDLVQEAKLDLSKWFNIAWTQRWSDGKLTGLGGGAGLSNVLVFYNKDWVMEATGSDLTDDWTMDDLVEVMSACVKLKGKGHFGSVVAMGGSVEADSWVCNWGKGYMDGTCTQSQFNDPKVQDALKWNMEQLKNGNFPGREDAAEGALKMFLGGKMALNINNPGASEGMVKGAAENGFELGVVLYPKGPSAMETPPRYGFCPYANCKAVSAQTKYPKETFDLMLRVLSNESFKWLNAQTGKQPGALLETWYDPDVAGKFPWFPKCADVMKACPPYYPVPANTRYKEWSDVGENEIQPLLYGDVPYTQANIDQINAHLQEIIDLPLPGA
jgi:ABC-type glycerol-3-phosphate transport system substrate-binding protein